MSITFPLSAPIEAHKQTLHELELREPTPEDARIVKAMPYWVAPDESVQLNPTAAHAYIVRLAGIPPSSVDQLDIGDFNNLCWVVARFFLKRASTKQTSSSEPPTT
ncbi:phage tail assembly protein [Cupriavidus gilardii]|uniref:phage tail assembly protein n=1 Tax=Cupriavidus gilardii TaxID=82541 RepID=UPI0007E45870|nr:phage tail assembly protein [Cupriavidus gilardii]